jgi:hypothetical protein
LGVSRRHFESSRKNLAALFLATGTALLVFVVLLPPPPAAARARVSAGHTICSGPGSAKVPCNFSTPSGNIRCVWTPKPNNVACVLRANVRAYRLRPTGKAKSISLKLARPGKALPLNQQLVFPNSLSCRDTRRTMVCNQDFGTGAFTLAPGGSHRS